jgi:mRNA interferase MazF
VGPTTAEEIGIPEAEKDAAMKRYEIHWARLDPVEGSEMAKQRPVVIVSLNVLNAQLQTVTICPITSKLHPGWRTRLAINCGGRPAEIAVDQIRTLSKTRLGASLGRLDAKEASDLRDLIAELYTQP